MTDDKVGFIAWWRRDFKSPAPHFVKMSVLCSVTDIDVWVETGTYIGTTTLHLANAFEASTIISIEPSSKMIEIARKKLSGKSNVQLRNGTSETELLEVLDSLVQQDQRNIAFWLDGHFSGGPTYLGNSETPIKLELEMIAKYLNKFERVYIFIDDFRCFVEGYQDYPSTAFLSSWAQSNNCRWSVEHDIFILIKL